MAQVHIVLVRPRRPENIGAVARAIGNTGLAGLRLVQPGDWRTVEAFRMAWQAEDVLEDAAVFPTLAEAVRGCRLVAGLSGRGREVIQHLTPRELAGEIAAIEAEGEVAVVFGNESSGLTLEERKLCQRQVRIPASPRQPSLNLAQAVMIAAYEILLASGPSPEEPVRRATAEQTERALLTLRDAMLAVGFLPSEKPEARFVEWRELFGRAGLTERETRMMMAFTRRVKDAGTRAGKPRPRKGAPVPEPAHGAERRRSDDSQEV